MQPSFELLFIFIQFSQFGENVREWIEYNEKSAAIVADVMILLVSLVHRLNCKPREKVKKNKNARGTKGVNNLVSAYNEN